MNKEAELHEDVVQFIIDNGGMLALHVMPEAILAEFNLWREAHTPEEIRAYFAVWNHAYLEKRRAGSPDRKETND